MPNRRVPAQGSYRQVKNGTARHTPGGLTSRDIMRTRDGRLVSRARHLHGKKMYKHIKNSGWTILPGTNSPTRVGTGRRSTKRRSTRRATKSRATKWW